MRIKFNFVTIAFLLLITTSTAIIATTQDNEVIDLTKGIPDENSAYEAEILSKTKTCPKDKQRPVVLVPGLLASVVEGKLTGIPSNITLPHKSCKRNTTKWETFWAEPSRLLPKPFDCLCSYISMDIDPVTGASKNKEGVELRVPQFGSLYAVDRVVPKGLTKGMSDVYHRIISTLKKAGFVEGETLFGAGYDWRRFPHEEWFNATSKLIETAVNKTGKRVVVVSHSMGGPYTYELLMSKSKAWRNRYVEHWIPISPVLSGTPLAIYAMLAKSLPVLPKYISDIARIAANAEEQYYLLPKRQYGTGHDVFIKSNKHQYTQEDFPELFDRIGVKHGRVLTQKAQAFVDRTQLRHPGVKASFLVSKGLPTVSGGSYLFDSEIGSVSPTPIFGDGDGIVTTQGLTQVAKMWMTDDASRNMTELKVIKSIGVNHLSILYTKEVRKFIETNSCEQ